MNIILATDDNFVQHCCVTMTSILKNNSNVVFYLFTEGLSNCNTELLKEQVNSLDGILNICIVDSSIVSKFPMPSFMSNHISIATYYRLFSADILPANVDKAIYLDCDIVVNDSLQSLWDMEISNYALGAVYQSHQHNQESYKRLSIPPEDGYFNAGVLLMNIKYWREKSVTDRLLGFVKSSYHLIHAHDQDVLNAVLHKETVVLDYIWNYRECFFNNKHYDYPNKVDYDDLNRAPIIIHYVSKPKPWTYACTHPYKSLYYEYLQKTPFKNFRPKFKWGDFYEFKLIPFIIKYDKYNIRHIFLKRKKRD